MPRYDSALWTASSSCLKKSWETRKPCGSLGVATWTCNALDPVELGALLQEDGEPRPARFEEPQAVLQAADRLLLADVDLLVERRDRLGGVVAVPDQELRRS